MGEHRPIGSDSWPLILGGMLRRPWAFLVVLGAIVCLASAPFIGVRAGRTLSELRPELFEDVRQVRSAWALAAADPGEPLGVRLKSFEESGSGATFPPPLTDEVARMIFESGKNIVAIDASFTLLDARLIERIAGLDSLERLRLGSVGTSDRLDPDLSPLLRLPNLRVLDMPYKELSDSDFDVLTKLPRLGTFGWGGPEATPDQSGRIAQFPQLQSIYPPWIHRDFTPAETWAPLKDSASLRLIHLPDLPRGFERSAFVTRRLLPGVEVLPSNIPDPGFSGWTFSLIGALLLASLGVPMVVWTGGPLPAAVPGYARGHRRVAWTLAASSLAAVAASLLACGVHPLPAVPAIAAAWGGLWWAQVRGLVATPTGEGNASRTGWGNRNDFGDWLPIILLGAVALLLWQVPAGGSTVLLSLGLAGVAAGFAWRLDVWLRGVERRSVSGGGGLRGSAREVQADRLAAGVGWPLRPDRLRPLKRVLVTVAVGGLMIVALRLGASEFDESNMFLWAFLPYLLINPLMMPVVRVIGRWRRRLSFTRVGVALPGSRRRRINGVYNEMALDFAGLWPIVVAAFFVAAAAARWLPSPPPPWSCGLLASLACVCLLAFAYGLTALLWPYPLGFGLATISLGVGWAVGTLQFFVGGAPVSWGPPVAGIVLLLAFAADRLARRRELAREWG